PFQILGPEHAVLAERMICRRNRLSDKIWVTWKSCDHHPATIEDCGNPFVIDLRLPHDLGDARRWQPDRQNISNVADPYDRVHHRYDMVVSERSVNEIRDDRLPRALQFLSSLLDSKWNLHLEGRPPSEGGIDELLIAVRLAQDDLQLQPSRNLRCLSMERLPIATLERMGSCQRRKNTLHRNNFPINRSRDISRPQLGTLLDLKAS